MRKTVLIFATTACAAFLAFASLIVCIGARPVDAAATTYDVKDLGTLGGDLSRGRDINDAGQVVGESRISTGQSRAFLYENGQMKNLGTLGGPASRAFSINDAGQVVGESRISSTSTQLRAFLYENGTMRNLGALPGAVFSRAWGINDTGQIVGESGIASDQGHAFLYEGGQMKDLGTLGGSFSVALNINDAGEVVGWSLDAEGRGHAFLYKDGEMHDLGTLPGGSYSEARDVNNAGQVVGSALNADNETRAFLYEEGQMKDLGTFGGPSSNTHGINDFGQVVGWSPTATNSPRAFVYEDGVMKDLNDSIPADSGWALVDAFGINASGQIVGIGTINGQSHAFLLTPNDATAPTTVATTSPEPNAAGWNKDDVTIELDATDEGGSNVEGITYSASGAQPIEETTVHRDSTTIKVAAEGETTMTYSAKDHTGNAEDPKTLTVRLDETAPGIDITTPADGGEYKLGETVAADYDCSDGGSGIDSCTGPVPVGGDVDTASIGKKTFEVAATDRAGNVTSESHTYSVVYDFGGFFSPVDNPDVLNRVQAGSAIPVKFGLGGDQGLDIFAEGYPKSQQIDCDSTAPIDNIEQTVNAGESGLSYDASLDRYTYVWKSARAWSGTCRQLVVKLDDGTVHRANFKFR